MIHSAQIKCYGGFSKCLHINICMEVWLCYLSSESSSDVHLQAVNKYITSLRWKYFSYNILLLSECCYNYYDFLHYYFIMKED